MCYRSFALLQKSDSPPNSEQFEFYLLRGCRGWLPWSIRIALENSGVTPDEVDYINAHGTSTALNDVAETKAIKAVFGERASGIPVSSTKSMIGHTIGAAGAIEAIASILSLHHQVVHPTINYETKDPECDLWYVPNKSINQRVNIAISNSFGFGSNNAVLVFGKY